MKASQYDICVVGGGIVGKVASIAIGTILKNKKICLLAPTPKQKTVDRAYAISKRNLELLKELKVMTDTALDNNPVQFPQKINIWDQTQAKLSLSSSSSEYCSAIIKNSLLEDLCLERIRQLPNVKTIQSNFDQYYFQEPYNTHYPHTIFVRCDNVNIESELLISCDGKRSKVRQQAGIKDLGHDYGQNAFVCEALSRPSATNLSIIWQRFLPFGPLGLLPLGNDKYYCIWSLFKEYSDKLEKKDNGEIVSLLNAYINWPYDQIQPIFHSNNMEIMDHQFPEDFGFFDKIPFFTKIESDTRGIFPLTCLFAETFYSSRLVLCGDSAHTLHPLSGQGLNCGLADIICLSDVIERASKSGEDIGSLFVLQEYDSRARAGFYKKMLLTTLSQKFMENESLENFREFTLPILDNLNFFKDFTIKLMNE